MENERTQKVLQYIGRFVNARPILALKDGMLAI